MPVDWPETAIELTEKPGTEKERERERIDRAKAGTNHRRRRCPGR